MCAHTCIVVYCYVFVLLLYWTMLDDWRLNFCSGMGKRTTFLISPHDFLLDQDSPLRYSTCSPLRRMNELLDKRFAVPV